MNFSIQFFERSNRHYDAICGLSPSALRELGIESGDVVRIESYDFPIVLRTVSTWSDERTIKVGNELSDTFDVESGDEVDVSAINDEPLEEVTLWIAKQTKKSVRDEPTMGSALEGTPTSKGSLVVTSFPAKRDRNYAEQIARVFTRDCVPSNGGTITDQTKVTVESKTGNFATSARAGLRNALAEMNDRFEPKDTSDASSTNKPERQSESDSVSGENASESEPSGSAVSYGDIGGLHDEIEQVRELVELPFTAGNLINHLGTEPPKGILFYGPPGTGKTLLARAVAHESEANFYSVAGSELLGQRVGETAQNLRDLFESAQEDAPSVLFIDELEVIARERGPRSTTTEEATAQLLTLMDGLDDRGDVVVIGATNRPNELDEAVRRGGRFTREIAIDVPTESERREILSVLSRDLTLNTDVDIDAIAERTHGWVGADLDTLVREAGLAAVRRIHQEADVDFTTNELSDSQVQETTIRQTDFEDGFDAVKPSGIRDSVIEVPDVSWDDIGGQTAAKHELKKAVEWPLKYDDIYDHLDLDVPTGVLLHGPPGTGKTLLAKAVANESDCNFIAVKGDELSSKWLGQSQANVREIFEKARRNAPAVLFFDEFDAIAGRRDQISAGSPSDVKGRISQLLTELDGLESLTDVIVIGTTNYKKSIDPAVLRDGRIDNRVEVGEPDKDGRLEILQINTRDKPLGESVQLDKIAEMAEGFNGAALASLCEDSAEAVLESIVQSGSVPDTEEEMPTIEHHHFEQALERLNREREFEEDNIDGFR